MGLDCTLKSWLKRLSYNWTIACNGFRLPIDGENYLPQNPIDSLSLFIWNYDWTTWTLSTCPLTMKAMGWASKHWNYVWYIIFSPTDALTSCSGVLLKGKSKWSRWLWGHRFAIINCHANWGLYCHWMDWFIF